MFQDLCQTAKNWRLVHLLGISNLRTRYTRSKMGQSWLTISLFIQIVSTGMVWSVLWELPIREFLPYVAVSQTIYQLFYLIIQESTTLFLLDSRVYTNQALPFLTSVFSNVYKNTIVFLHTLPIILFVGIFATQGLHLSWLLCVMIVVSWLFLISVSYIVACVCTRYRDVVQIVGSLLQISFLVTPILWKMNDIPPAFRKYFYLNPLAAFLELLRNPLMGLPVSHYAYFSVIMWMMAAVACMLLLHRSFEKKIIYWI